MSLFNPVVNKSIEERSTDILSTFADTAKQLTEINEEATLVQEMNNQVISKRQAENDRLEKRKKINAVVVSNIDNFLGKDVK